jgi:nucleotide-binding universal stress UspA family protein
VKNIVACIDGSPISQSVCDGAAWASSRLNAPLCLLHALEKTERALDTDFSGNMTPGHREHLLEELTSLDEQRAKLALEHGKHMLTAAEARAREDGAVEIFKMQRHGSLVESLLDLESDTRLFVMGRLGEDHDSAAMTMGSHLESAIRALHRSILITLQQFTAPKNFMLAYDGSATADDALSRISLSPLLEGLPCHLVMVGKDAPEKHSVLEKAALKLQEQGFTVTSALIAGEVQYGLQTYQQEHGIDLMAMGAYGHSRIRQFILGSTTSTMLAQSTIPLLILR